MFLILLEEIKKNVTRSVLTLSYLWHQSSKRDSSMKLHILRPIEPHLYDFLFPSFYFLFFLGGICSFPFQARGAGRSLKLIWWAQRLLRDLLRPDKLRHLHLQGSDIKYAPFHTRSHTTSSGSKSDPEKKIKNKKMAKLFRHAGERIQPGEAHFTMDRGSGCIETFTDMFGDVLLASKFPDASFL